MEGTRRMLLAASLVTVPLLGLVGMSRPIDLRAADPPWDPPPCVADGRIPSDRPAVAANAHAGAWFRLEPSLDERGWLVGRRLHVGWIGRTPGWLVDLPAESFAAGPYGGRVLVGDDDGRRSRLRWVDPDAGCALEVGVSSDVVRSAVLVPAEAAVVEHRVDRATRTDLGIWRRPLDGSEPDRVLAALPDDRRFGPTFETTISAAVDGAVAVAACGRDACRMRVRLASGHVLELAPTGPVVGLTGDALVAYDACRGLPCPLEAVDLRSGVRRVLVDAAGLAAVTDAGGGLVAYETAAGGVEVVASAGGRPRRVAEAGSSLMPLVSSSRAAIGLELPAGWIPLVADEPGPASEALRALDPTAASIRRPVEILR